mgnify:CR=1 FL=1
MPRPTPELLKDVYKRMLKAWGPQHWWPGETPFEVMVGAILTQNTAWTNVEKAIKNLKAAGVLDPRQLHELPLSTLAALIRPAGYYNVKAKRLKSYLAWFVERFDGSVERMFELPLSSLREELLGVKGIGPETADSILLYAGGLPSFVVDAYTYRILLRHGMIAEDATYDDIKELFETRLARDVKLWNEVHALLVHVGKDHCRSKPRCEGCPLDPIPRG